MNALLIKIFAIGLTVSQVLTRPPEQFKAQFADGDEAEMTAILNAGCSTFMKEFNKENADLEDLIQLAIDMVKADKERNAADPQATPAPPVDEGKKKVSTSDLKQLDFSLVLQAYKMFCKGEKLANPSIKLTDVIPFYNQTMKDLPDHAKLKNLHLPEASVILDQSGKRFSEIYSDDNRRQSISIKDLPPYVRQAFVAAEDKHFYQHKGVDINGIVRAFKSSMSGDARPQGGSTITQQVIKNLLVGNEATFERKMREMVLATRLEKLLSKDEILELYINQVFLGYSSWGIGMGAKSYFNKPAQELTPGEAAFLAGLVKGPNYYNAAKNMDRCLERRQYVLNRMKEDGYLKPEQYDLARAEKVDVKPFESPHERAAFYFLDEIQQDAKRQAKIPSLTSGSYVVKSTIMPELQKVVEKSLEDGLFDYEMAAGRSLWTGPVGNLTEEIQKNSTDSKPATWRDIFPRMHSKYYDIQWPYAIVTSTGGRQAVVDKKGRTSYVNRGFMVGLKDGTEWPLIGSPNIMRLLKVNDMVHVKIDESKKRAVLLIPPQVQGGVVVLEAKTGRVLALAGGFSYPKSQLNRVTQTARQPGSTLKPFIHLAALNLGLQPDTLIPNVPLPLPPIGGRGKWWTPKNYDGGAGGLVSIRQTVERSLNIPTERVMAGMANTPVEGLDYIRGITHEIGAYPGETLRLYPFALGAQPARLLDMAVAYATLANIGVPVSQQCVAQKTDCRLKPQPYFIDSIEQNGRLIWHRDRENSRQPIDSLDRVALYQIRRITEGTVARGTAVAMKDLTGFVAGKTGTSNNENDAWFIAYTNDLVVATWVGYDSRNVKASLGGRFTGARVALPIGERIIRKSFEIYAPKEALVGAPADLRRQIVEYPIPGGGFDVFRLSATGPISTRNALLRDSELGMAELDNPMGEEDDGREYNNLSDDDQRQVGAPMTILPQDPNYSAYRPGAEDNFEMWQRRGGRTVDPQYLNFPSLFNR